MRKTLAALAMLPSVTFAGVCFDGGNYVDPACNTDGLVLEQVFLDSATNSNVVYGHLGSQIDPRIVEFTSGDLLNANEGFAQITGITPSGNPGFDDLTFGMLDPTLGMDAVTFDLRSSEQGTLVEFFYETTDGGLGGFGLVELDNGINQITMVADPESLARVAFQTTGFLEMANFKHLRIDPCVDTDCGDGGVVDPQGIDAPGMAALLSMGLVGLYASRRKNREDAKRA